MATLFSKSRHLSVQIQPVMPNVDGPHNAYDVAVREQGRVLFERRYTTYADSPDGHWNVWRLFRAFQLTEPLAVSETPFSLTGRGAGLFNEPATLSINAGWLHAVLSADTLVHCRNQSVPFVQRRSRLDIYLLVGPQEMGCLTSNYQHFGMSCEPADLAACGQLLEAECREALRLRRELRLLAPADGYIDD